VERNHIYRVGVTWTGNLGRGTRDYSGYSRDHIVEVAGKAPLPASSDPLFRGDPARYNPEELLVAALSSCHMLWYLHLCADAGVEVAEYVDRATGKMVETADGGRFEAVTLSPAVVIASGSDPAVAARLHEEAHRRCFIARSVSFPVLCEAQINVADLAQHRSEDLY
jgi:organic hydroperoxide reductase OsmC/OhrA